MDEKHSLRMGTTDMKHIIIDRRFATSLGGNDAIIQDLLNNVTIQLGPYLASAFDRFSSVITMTRTEGILNVEKCSGWLDVPQDYVEWIQNFRPRAIL